MELSPGMRQYMHVKDRYPDCVVLFRMGDFYETFYEDAKTVARELDIVLTSRGKGEKKAPLAGIPYHALDSYLGKLIKKGYKVCIVEQIEDPKLAKGLVKRDVVRIITPGTVIENNLLQESSNNFIAAINKENNRYGIAFADISTAEFLATEAKDELKLYGEIDKFKPAEIIVPLSFLESQTVKDLKQKGYYINSYDDRFFWLDKSKAVMKEHFKVLNLEGFGLEGKDIAITSAGALLSYLKDTQFNSLSHINRVQTYVVDDFMILDSSTQRNLELLKNIKDGTSRGTLFEVINKTVTSMGARKLKRWLLHPLIKVDAVNYRLDAVAELLDNEIAKEEIREILAKFSDLERITSRIIYNTANARDILALRKSLELIPKLKELLKDSDSRFLKDISTMEDFAQLAASIAKSIKDEPAATVREGNLIREGYSKELDELREISSSGKQWMAKLEEKEKERTGIKSLRISYNKVFGYFIEVTKANLHLVPKDYIRKQTQVNCERYVTEELKSKEDMILGAQDRIFALEFDLFSKILLEVSGHIRGIQDCASRVSSLDCLVSLATVAAENNYCRPEILEDSVIHIIAGRHPVVEKMEQSFVDNDCRLNIDERMKIITGPNMAGKSTYLRQNALIVLLSQMGSYVPASSAHIGIVDRIFTRVGAYDDLSMGQSTFMVEMTEAANILNNATARSFVILDEIGRGTSTYDGLSLAWAIASYLYSRIGAKTLFATHYHHLNKMAEMHEGIRNYHVLVNENDENITFLRKIVSGGTDKSYGIHVAKLAGLPLEVVQKSREMMRRLEEDDSMHDKIESSINASIDSNQLKSTENSNTNSNTQTENLNSNHISNPIPIASSSVSSIGSLSLEMEGEAEELKREIHITETITRKKKQVQKTLFDM